MNTFLKTFATILSAGVPAVFTLEAFGVHLPAAINTWSVLSAFVLTLIALTMLSDYREAKPLPVVSNTPRVAAQPKAVLRLAA